MNGKRESGTYVGTVSVNNVGQDVLIGRQVGGFYTNAVYDDFGYYKRALTADEVRSLYDGVGCNPSDLRMAYRYGFNGKEKDDEVMGMSGSSYDFGACIPCVENNINNEMVSGGNPFMNDKHLLKLIKLK